VTGGAGFNDSARFEPGGTWVHPKERARQQAAVMLPRGGTIKAEEDRLFELAKHAGRPKVLQEAISAARDAIREAHAALDHARSPEAPAKARDAESKQAAVDAIDAARDAVTAAVRVSEQDDVQAEQYQNLAAGIPDAQRRAAEALEEAAAAFTEWRNQIDAAHDVAVATGRFGPEWHKHPDERSINPRRLIGELRRARDLTKTEDAYLSGEYLSDDPTPEGEIPEWTMRALRRSAEVAGSGSYAWQVLVRLVNRDARDAPVQEAIQRRDLRVVYTSAIPDLSEDSSRAGSGTERRPAQRVVLGP
jgi:hypothetical protein